MSHPPFMIIPQNATPYYPTGATPLLPAIRTPLLFQPPAPPAPVSNGPSAATPSVAGKPNPHPIFKAPAHKHAHHLHSIPPREKSTRTLIIDHLLWVHSRTRFAQARAELGMTDRTGGSSSPNYVHRERPEHFEEEDEVASDGECVSVLRHRSGWSADEEDARSALEDPPLAKALRTRSESVEKVVASMLHQPPEVRPIHPHDITNLGSPESKKQTPVGTNSHPHTLPNGVRLRAALATLINDFFARESHPPSTQTLNSYLPPGIVPLLPISSLISDIPASLPHANHFTRQHRRPPVTPSAQTLSLYAAGVDPSTSPAPRCPRHLYTACTICVPPPGAHQASRKPVVTSFPAGHPNTVTGWQDGGGIGSGLSSGPKKDDTLLRRKYHGTTNLVDLISRFLKLSALVAMELGVEADERGSVGAPQWGTNDAQNQGSSPQKGKARAISTSSFDPRSPTPSAQQQNDSSPGSSDSGEKIQMQLYALRPSSEWYALCAGLLTRAVLEGYMCGGWKGLGALETLMKVGLGLRPDVLDIPVEESPRPSVDANDESPAQEYHHHYHHRYNYRRHHDHDDPYEEFDPDDFPTITESAKVLFPSLRQRATSIDSMGMVEQQVVKEAPEQEYEYDVEERLSSFYDVQPMCPDLSTHLEDISWQYPAEPLERAMLRFFEAISKWRGKPELETYKKSPRNLSADPSTGIVPLSMDALVHSSPIVGLGSPGKKRPQGPRIEKYFLPPPQSGGTIVSGMGLKRRRESVSVTLDSATKRMRSQFDALASMGPSPMGTTSMGSTPMGSTPGGP